MSNTPKRYRLLKDLPDAKEGDVYYNIVGSDLYKNERQDSDKSPVIEYNTYFKWQVEDNPEWFELIQQEEIKITINGIANKFPFYQFMASHPIPEEKLPLIKKAIEAALNDDAPPSWVKDSKYLVSTDLGKSHMILISPEELEQAEKDAFENARKYNDGVEIMRDWRMKYPTFQDYKKEKQPLVSTSSNEFERFNFKGWQPEQYFKGTENINEKKSETSSVGRDWEIVSFMKDDKLLEKDGQGWKYRNETNSISDIEFIIRHCKIHSVKRLSDGVVFSVGDEVEYRRGGDTNWEQTWPAKIKEFILPREINKESKLIVELDDNHEYNDKYYPHKHLDNIRKKLPPPSNSKEPLFVSHDGKQVYAGDKVWLLFTMSDSSWKPSETMARTDLLPVMSYQKYFSTQEAANEYVLMNKKCLSISDLKKVFAPEYVPRIEELMELAKKNLKNGN